MFQLVPIPLARSWTTGGRFGLLINLLRTGIRYKIPKNSTREVACVVSVSVQVRPWSWDESEKEEWMGKGGDKRKVLFFSSPPPPSFIIFYFRSNFCAITRSEKLATQATREESELDLIRMDWSDCAVPYICQWFNVCFPLCSSMWMNERELSKGKDEFFTRMKF